MSFGEGDSNLRPERRRGFPLSRQLRLVAPLVVVWTAGLVFLGFVADRDEPGRLLVDPAYAAGGQWYDGVVSELGILAWSIAAVTAACAGWLAHLYGRRRAGTFLRLGAAVSAMLLIDDLFDLHAVATWGRAPKAFGEGILLAVVAAWTVHSWSEIRRTPYGLLFASFAASAVSVVVDLVARPSLHDRSLVLEDGSKFLGILAWALYFVVTAAEISQSIVSGVRLPAQAARTAVATSAQRATDVSGSAADRNEDS